MANIFKRLQQIAGYSPIKTIYIGEFYYIIYTTPTTEESFPTKVQIVLNFYETNSATIIINSNSQDREFHLTSVPPNSLEGAILSLVQYRDSGRIREEYRFIKTGHMCTLQEVGATDALVFSTMASMPIKSDLTREIEDVIEQIESRQTDSQALIIEEPPQKDVLLTAIIENQEKKLIFNKFVEYASYVTNYLKKPNKSVSIEETREVDRLDLSKSTFKYCIGIIQKYYTADEIQFLISFRSKKQPYYKNDFEMVVSLAISLMGQVHSTTVNFSDKEITSNRVESLKKLDHFLAMYSSDIYKK